MENKKTMVIAFTLAAGLMSSAALADVAASAGIGGYQEAQNVVLFYSTGEQRDIVLWSDLMKADSQVSERSSLIPVVEIPALFPALFRTMPFAAMDAASSFMRKAEFASYEKATALPADRLAAIAPAAGAPVETEMVMLDLRGNGDLPADKVLPNAARESVPYGARMDRDTRAVLAYAPIPTVTGNDARIGPSNAYLALYDQKLGYAAPAALTAREAFGMLAEELDKKGMARLDAFFNGLSGEELAKARDEALRQLKEEKLNEADYAKMKKLYGRLEQITKVEDGMAQGGYEYPDNYNSATTYYGRVDQALGLGVDVGSADDAHYIFHNPGKDAPIGAGRLNEENYTGSYCTSDCDKPRTSDGTGGVWTPVKAPSAAELAALAAFAAARHLPPIPVAAPFEAALP